MTEKEANKEPIGLIIAADEPALFFIHPKDAEIYLEAVDVRSGVYWAAFGPNGEQFNIVVDRFDNIIICRIESACDQPERLREILNSFLKAMGIPFTAEMSLPDLIKLCSPYVQVES